jgi:hypothetical protein
MSATPTPTEAEREAARVVAASFFGDLRAWRDEDQPRVRKIRDEVAALITTALTDARDAARRLALEEAARVCEGRADDVRYAVGPALDQAIGAAQCADEIRALLAPGTGTGDGGRDGARGGER